MERLKGILSLAIEEARVGLPKGQGKGVLPTSGILLFHAKLYSVSPLP